MNIKTLMYEVKEAEYLGEVEGDRQTYYVYRGQRHYLLFTFSGTQFGNFNLVEFGAVKYVRNAFGGEKGLTSGSLLKRSRKHQYIQDRFDALRILYILVATKQATKRKNKPPLKGFLFNIKKVKQ